MTNDLQELQGAYQLHRQGRLVEAAGIYEKLIRRDPRNYDALHLLGTIKATQGNYTEAKRLLAHLIRPALEFKLVGVAQGIELA